MRNRVAKPYAIYSVGEAMREVFLPFKGFPASDTTLVWDSLKIKLGGPAINVAWHCTQLGLDAIPVCTIGEGDFATAKATFRRMGLQPDRLLGLQEETDILFSFLDEGNHHSFYLKGEFKSPPRLKDLPTLGEECLVVLCGGRHASVQKLFVDLVNTPRRCKVLFNPSYATYEYEEAVLREILEASDFVFLNAQEASYARLRLRVGDIAQFGERESSTLILMLGKDGVRAISPKESLELPSIAKEIANPIGGGDALVAGFVYSIAQGGSLRDALQVGSALAAIAVEDPQIRPAIALAELQGRLRSFGNA